MSSHRSAATKLKGLEKDGEIEKDGVGEVTVAVFAPSISFDDGIRLTEKYIIEIILSS